MSTYADKTSVSVEKSRAEIERILSRFGASQFISGWDQERAYIGFEMKNRMVKLLLPLPRKDDKRFEYTPGRRRVRGPEQRFAAWEQACRESWRALALMIKAKLAGVEQGVTTFDDEFLAHIVLPDGSTAGEFLKPQIKLAYETRKMPNLIPWVAGPDGTGE